MSKAGEFAPEGTSGQDLSDFESAFGGAFSGDPEPRQGRFDSESLEVEEDEFSDLDPLDRPEPEKKPLVPHVDDTLADLEAKQKAAREKWANQKDLKSLKRKTKG